MKVPRVTGASCIQKIDDRQRLVYAHQNFPAGTHLAFCERQMGFPADAVAVGIQAEGAVHRLDLALGRVPAAILPDRMPASANARPKSSETKSGISRHTATSLSLPVTKL